MKLIYRFLIILIITYSCTKETEIQDSKYQSEYDGWFSKDIEVKDMEGVNSAFFRVFAKTETILNDFIQMRKLTITTNLGEDLSLKSGMPSELFDETKSNQAYSYNASKEPTVVISHITSNLVEGVKGIQLHIENTEFKNGQDDWIHGDIYGYETTEPFIGLVHWEGLYAVLVHHRWKQYWYSVNWEHNPYTYWVGKTLNQYWYKFDWGNVYKRGLTVRHHLYQPQQPFPYYVAYASEDFRGNICEIGSWDSRNCYVGTAPAGTTAFVWPNNTGRFYYSASSGSNKCPLPGSWFDGSNCAYLKIPEDKTYGFVWDNKWYVKGNKILTY